MSLWGFASLAFVPSEEMGPELPAKIAHLCKQNKTQKTKRMIHYSKLVSTNPLRQVCNPFTSVLNMTNKTSQCLATL